MDKVQNPKIKNQNYKRILAIRLDRIGDVVLSTPALKALRDAYPQSYIACMVRPYAKDVVTGNPYINEVIIYDKDGLQNGLIGNLRFLSFLRRKHFDAAVVLHPTSRTHILIFLAGIPERIGYDRKCGFLLTRRISHAKQFGLKHEIDYTLDILRYIGIEPKDRSLYMPVKPDCEWKIKDILERSGIQDNDTIVAINPSAGCPSKRWRPENFAKVSDMLAEKYGVKIVVISSVPDKYFGDAVAMSMKNGCVNLSARTTVGDVASVLRRAKLFISNDTGPVHIACAVGTPVVVIFGRSDRGLSPRRWGPSGPNDVVIHKDVGCVTCHAHKCNNGFKCLEAVTVEEVCRAAEKFLTKRGNLAPHY